MRKTLSHSIVGFDKEGWEEMKEQAKSQMQKVRQEKDKMLSR